MPDKITWTTQTRKLSDLMPWPDNPRQIRDAQGKRLQTSLRKFGYSQLIEIEPDNTILDGHQRDNLMKIMKEFTADTLLEVRVSSRKFTDEERRQYILLKGQGATGEWNMDTLSAWDVPELMEFGGFTEIELGLKPAGDEWGAAMGKLPDEDRAPFQQMTFTLHDTQAETVKEALKAAQSLGAFVDSENENSNGNALARICEMFMEANGRG